MTAMNYFFYLPLTGRAAILLGLIMLLLLLLRIPILKILSMLLLFLRWAFRFMYWLLEWPVSALHKLLGGALYNIDNSFAAIGQKIDKFFENLYNKCHKPKSKKPYVIFIVLICLVCYFSVTATTFFHLENINWLNKCHVHYLHIEDTVVKFFESKGWHFSNPNSSAPAVPSDPTTSTAKPQQPTEPRTANPTNDKLMVNGVTQNLTVYKIDENNYFKLRDMAAVLNGTEKQFNVDYNYGKVTVTSNQPYEATGKELQGSPSSTGSAISSNDSILMNGSEVSLTVYKIDGSNYFKLRDLGKLLDFYVGWTTDKVVYIETGKPYAE